MKKLLFKSNEKNNNELKYIESMERKGLKHKLGKYEVIFPDCSYNFSKIKVFRKDCGIEYEYRGTSEYLDERVGSRAVRYLYGMRVRHFGKLEYDKNRGFPKGKYMTLIQYRGMSDGFETEYELKKHSIKNIIVLPDYTNTYEFVYLINTSNLMPCLSQDKKKIRFYDIKNKSIISILNPYIYDSVGECCENVHYEINKYSENGYSVIISIDKIWSEDLEKVRPLYLVFPMVF